MLLFATQRSTARWSAARLVPLSGCPSAVNGVACSAAVCCLPGLAILDLSNTPRLLLPTRADNKAGAVAMRMRGKG